VKGPVTTVVQGVVWGE